MGKGYLTFKVATASGAEPIKDARVVIKDASGHTLNTLKTDASGRTETVALPAPDKVHTLNPNYRGVTYAIYSAEIKAPGFVTEIFEGIQIFDTVESVQESDMLPSLTADETENVINITPHGQMLKVPRNQQGPKDIVPLSRVLPRVIIPEYITVHLGRYNLAARNIRVPFPLYIKNVASSEIYPTWPEASLEANIRAIINFALNRVYTEWYRSRGYNFDITSSTATDMYFVEGRDIFTSISVIVDKVIGEYLRRPNHNEPFFTSFCDGRTANCAGLLQWGTVTLAERGYTPMQILRHYYPNDLMIDTAPIAPIVESFPGVSLSQGSQGPDVERMQKLLNRIRQNYPLIPNIATPNGVYGADTASAVRAFQQIFSMPQTGIIDRATWNRITYIFVAVAKLSELTSEGDRIVTGTVPPNQVISIGSFGGLVTRLQFMLTYLSQFYPEVPELRPDGSFGSNTRNAVIAFQTRFGLTPDGVVGPSSWNKIYEVYFAAKDVVKPPAPPPAPPPTPTPPPTGPVYPGTPLRVGSTGENVRIMQQYLTALSSVFPSIPALTADGVFGPITESAVIAFQRQFGLTADGIIGPSTWNAIVGQYNKLQTITPPQYITHTVVAGDTLWLLAQRFGTTVDAIKSLNNLTSDLLMIGQQLKIPLSYISYTVQAGDTLWLLAQRFGTTVEAIKTLNNLTSDVILVGQQLKIPATTVPAQYTIVIDAGHGGTDPGAVNGTRLEKNDNLDMALAVQQRLRAQGQRVIMTRSTDVFVPLEERSAISNSNNADIFVSMHRNASTNTSANGSENFVQNGAPPINVRYAQNVQGEIVSAGVQRNGGIKHGNYAVLRNTQAPAMMLELGYITNDEDNRLFDQNFDAYADAITRGILLSLGETFPPPVPLPYSNYTVQNGDNLWIIAQRFGTTMEAIIALNRLTDTNVSAGQILKIPNAA